MFKMFTTSFTLLTAFASLALAQEITVTVTKTLTLSTYGAQYTTTSESTYTTDASSPTSTSSSASATSSGATTTHSIQVGPSGQLVYSPSNITANVGDTVEFFFNPKNHTVTQSSFTAPCQKLEASTGTVGLDSGFNPTTESLTTVGFSFVVNGTSPLWFYCRQTGHCIKGMVFAVNANDNKTFAAFQANAENSNSSLSSSTASISGSGSSATGSATDTGTGAATATSSSSPANDNGAISTSVSVGLTAVLAVVGGFILAL